MPISFIDLQYILLALKTCCARVFKLLLYKLTINAVLNCDKYYANIRKKEGHYSSGVFG